MGFSLSLFLNKSILSMYSGTSIILEASSNPVAVVESKSKAVEKEGVRGKGDIALLCYFFQWKFMYCKQQNWKAGTRLASAQEGRKQAANNNPAFGCNHFHLENASIFTEKASVLPILSLIV